MIVQEKKLLYLESSEAYSRNIILMLVLCVCVWGGGAGFINGIVCVVHYTIREANKSDMMYKKHKIEFNIT